MLLFVTSQSARAATFSPPRGPADRARLGFNVNANGRYRLSVYVICPRRARARGLEAAKNVAARAALRGNEE